MRKFGTDAPEFMEFTLGDDETVHRLPLAASMPMQTLIELQEASAKGSAATLKYQMGLLRRYIGDVADELKAEDFRAIFDAWALESAKQGATAGE